jgi:carboxyl-terminal processing protease
MVMSVRENGPAAGAGLLSGDIIIEADSTKLRWLTVEEASKVLRGEPGTDLLLTIFRPVSSDTIPVQLKRAQIDLLHIPFAGYTPDSILYIRLLDFDAGAAQDVEAALDSLLADNGSPKGVILDMRGNPGGLFSEAYETANLFLENGQFIVGTSARSRWNERDYYSSGDDVTGGAPMAVLVDRGSASAAEIVGGALSQLDRAILVGDTTFGKGLVQGFTRFWDGSGMRLTISRYYLEGDVFLNEFDSTLEDIGHGLPPDHYFRSQERYEFPRNLERSLLLQEFANQHQDEIVSSSGEFRLSAEWVDRFESYCRSKGFQFASGATQAALVMNEVANLDRARIPLVKTVGQVLRRARAEDRRQFDRYADYIKMRLKQIAYERKYGIYEAYAKVLVRERPEIQLATQLLLDNPS